jgi:hypothetical protein
MKTALLKTAFVVVVVILTIVFLIPVSILRDAMLPLGRGPDGLQRNVDTLLPGVLAVFFCVYLANRIASFLFWRTHLSDERWSIIKPDRR